MTDDFVITPNPSQQARYRTRCGFPSELCPPGSAAIDLKRRKTHLLRRAISGRHPDVLEGIDQPIESRSPSGVSQIVIRRMWVGSGLSWRGFPRSVACNSATQIDDLVEAVTPFAIGMADNIDDGDAINYAAQFYAAVAYGQSIASAHASGQAALELAGLDGAELPTLAWAPDVDPTTTILVTPT